MQSLNSRRGEEEKRRRGENKRVNSFDNLFDTDWEVFVIKQDKTTGKLIGRTACCALAKVD